MRKSTLISLLLALVFIGGLALWRYMPRTLSYDECSDIYRRYADMQLDGVRITYFKDKIINDTLRLPVTLLEAETDRGWEQIDSLFGYSKTIDSICNLPELPDSVKTEFISYLTSFYTYRAHRVSPDMISKHDDIRPDDICVFIFHNMRCVTIYEPVNMEEEYEAIMNRSIVNQEEMTQQ